ncbi:hypothetical protein GCM10009724_23780 [Microbacterium lacticum]|nr:hypothetical protein MLA01_23340 [Microbacterium lacticum]GGI72065.1 hypothetical protein GCM10009724_23780 [Microbacterium lacticum]
MRMCDAQRHPTIVRLNASMMKQTCATPAHVGTNVRSVTQSRFGAVAVNSRFTRSGCRADVGSGRVVFTRLLRVAPSMPVTRMSRPVWSRPMSIPARRAVFQSLRTP